MSVINRATAHYSTQEKLVIAVPEWGDEDGPLQIHVSPMTMADMNTIRSLSSKKASNIEQAANIIVAKATDENGKRLFSAVGDRDKLMTQADYRVVSRIAECIEEHFFGDMEQTKGNSDATSSDETN